MGGDKQFVLADSGHVAGVINAPHKKNMVIELINNLSLSL